MVRPAVILGLIVFLAGGGRILPTGEAQAKGGITFTPIADTYVSSAARHTNFGRAKSLRVGAPSPHARAYLRFRVTGLDAPVSFATLRVFVRKASRPLSVGMSISRWSERGLTYANEPRVFRGIASSGRVRAGRWVSLNVTRAVKANGLINFVLTGRGATSISSREAGSTRPQLIVSAVPPSLVAAGDIADCTAPWDEATAALVNNMPGTVAALGDLAYENGSLAEFNACYQPTWGKFKARTKPAPGNHEYQTPGAAGYFAYWGAAAGNPSQGWYSYDLGGWHLISLNSNCSFIGGCQAGSSQEAWLRADLAAHRTRCTLAYWHHPRYSGGLVTGDPDMAPIWQALYDNDADLVLVGHAHSYQRFAPQNAFGVADAARGMREFVVGTGGRAFHPAAPSPNSEVVNDSTYGVLQLSLRNSGYDWHFVPVAGQKFTDSGSQACH